MVNSEIVIFLSFAFLARISATNVDNSFLFFFCDLISLVFEDLDFDTYKLLSVSWLDPANPNPACNQAVWGTHSGSIQAFYADAVPFTFSAENSELSLVVSAVANTQTPPCPPTG